MRLKTCSPGGSQRVNGCLDRKIRLFIYGALLATGTVFLFVGGPDYYSSRSFKYLWDMGHIAYFSLFAVLLLRWRIVATRSLLWQWTIILVATLLVGVSIELLQYGTSRTPSAWDVLHDLAGSVLVLVFGPPGSSMRPAGWRHLLQLVVLLLVSLQLWPLTKSLIDEAVGRQQFPVLSDFETPFEIDRWQGNAIASVETVPSISRGRLLKISFATSRFSGISLKYFDGNWTPFHTLKISLYNPDVRPLQIRFRVHDLQHADGHEEYEDRFNRHVLLVPGWNHIEIDLHEVKESPASRSMDMGRIRGLGLYVASQPAPRILYLETVLLSR